MRPTRWRPQLDGGSVPGVVPGRVLVTGAAILGARVVANANGTVEIRGAQTFDGSKAASRAVTVLAVNEFTSARKRVSVIARDRSRRRVTALFLRLKGADNSACWSGARPPRDVGRREIRSATHKHLDAFARDGLRTLVLAERALSEAETEDWTRARTPASDGAREPGRAARGVRRGDRARVSAAGRHRRGG